MYLVYTPDGIVLVRIYYVTCLNLLFIGRTNELVLYVIVIVLTVA